MITHGIGAITTGAIIHGMGTGIITLIIGMIIETIKIIKITMALHLMTAHPDHLIKAHPDHLVTWAAQAQAQVQAQ
jgi:hypothetical protein